MPPFLQNLMSLPAKTKALLGVSAVAILAIAFLMLKIATAPSYALIASGLDPAQTGKITSALDEQGIAYELRNNGTALAVSKASTAQARIALAAQGVEATGGSQPGYELLDESKLGASQFQQQAAYQRALEGEVARTLRTVQGVQNPTVRLVLPQVSEAEWPLIVSTSDACSSACISSGWCLCCCSRSRSAGCGSPFQC